MKNSILVLAIALVSQVALAESPQNSQATIFFLHNNWTAKASNQGNKLKTSEGVFGLSAVLARSDRFAFELDGTLANAKIDPDGSESLKLSSLNDTRVAGTFYSAKGLTSFTAFANLPTGKTKLDDEQYNVASVLADNSQKFLVRRFGQGLDIGAEGMLHPKAGNMTFHLGAGYLLKGKFQARKDDTEKYKFGDEISAMAGLGYQQDKIAFLLDGGFVVYMKDKVGDAEVFQAGTATTIRGSVSYTDKLSLVTGVALLMRGKGKVQGSASSSDLVDEAERSGRNEFLWFGGVGYPVNEKLKLNGRIEFQNFSENDYADDTPLYKPKSNYIGIGGGGSYALTPNFFASTMVTLYTGKIDGPANTSMDADLSGLGLVLALTYRAM